MVQERVVSAAKIPLFNGRPGFTRVRKEDLARYVLISVRDPLAFKRDAAEEIAKYMDEAHKVADSHMYVIYTGTYKGTRVSVLSTGSGAPDTELALIELMRLGADTFIRVGTSGAIQEHVKVGDIVIASGAVRSEGTSKQYVSTEYPACAHWKVLTALIEAAESLGCRYHVGITRSIDAFWVGSGRPSFNNYLQKEHEEAIDYWRKAGVLNLERETSVILTLAGLFGLRAGSVCSAVNNLVQNRLEFGAGNEQAIKTALEAIAILGSQDSSK